MSNKNELFSIDVNLGFLAGFPRSVKLTRLVVEYLYAKARFRELKVDKYIDFLAIEDSDFVPKFGQTIDSFAAYERKVIKEGFNKALEIPEIRNALFLIENRRGKETFFIHFINPITLQTEKALIEINEESNNE